MVCILTSHRYSKTKTLLICTCAICLLALRNLWVGLCLLAPLTQLIYSLSTEYWNLIIPYGKIYQQESSGTCLPRTASKYVFKVLIKFERFVVRYRWKRGLANIAHFSLKVKIHSAHTLQPPSLFPTPNQNGDEGVMLIRVLNGVIIITWG